MAEEKDTVKKCWICSRVLNNPNDPKSIDCGGDCLACIEECEADLDRYEASK